MSGFVRTTTGTRRSFCLTDSMLQYLLRSDFCEFHGKVEEKIVDEYLSYWSSYKQLERAKECFEIARRLGWLLRIYVQPDCICASRPHGYSPFEEEIANTWIRSPTVPCKL